ncbi:MAG TPA: TerD family protein [Alphaproteobacteria bacterium]
MSHIFKRNQQVSIRQLGINSTILMIGIGWDNKRKPGFLNKLLKERYDCDLDLSCVMYDQENEKLDTVWYAQLQSKCGGVRHKGDETVGDEIDQTEGDDESMTIDLNQMNEETRNVFFVVSSFKGSRFDQVENCYWRIYDPVQQKEVGRYNFSSNDKARAKIVLNLQKRPDEGGLPQWYVKALDENATGKNIQEVLPEIRELLGD